ncbi:MAG TPA: peptidylprolyl isomerase [Sphingomicrobium sp.]|jgi:peptidyl-prolyl cis-trans isomerase C|nr:peptidylprolyl isomerase [Sphingomicrobium sp.]
MINVNGVMIGDDAVAREMQHHPSSSREEAEREAATALVVRELLLQRVKEKEIAGADEDERIANLIDSEIRVPEPNSEEIARYYRRNGLQFTAPALYRAAHIFFPARSSNEAASAQAIAKAEAVLAEVAADPTRFAELALAHSACSSKEQGGSLGLVRKGDTNPEIERALATMEIGSIKLVRSRHGYHVLRLDDRAPANQLPLEQASGWIAEHLRKTSKRRAIAQYLQLLTARAKISGIDLAATDSPLVQ